MASHIVWHRESHITCTTTICTCVYSKAPTLEGNKQILRVFEAFKPVNILLRGNLRIWGGGEEFHF